MKQRARAVAGLPGVRGDSAQGQISRGTWEVRYSAARRRRCNCGRESITARRLRRESERPIVAKKSGNADRAKGPCWKQADVRGKENRLGQPTTEDPVSNGSAVFPEKLS